MEAVSEAVKMVDILVDSEVVGTMEGVACEK